MRSFARLACLCLLLTGTGCSLFKPEDHFGATPVSFEALSGWQESGMAASLQAFLQSCPPLMKKAAPAAAGSGLQVPEPVWQSLCTEAAVIPTGNDTAAQAFFERRFAPYRVTNNGREQGLFTGYYEPLLYGSYKKKGDFLYPLYLLPPDVKDGTPYYTHAEINNGALDGRKLELLWVDDPVMRFFMQIQGSGRVRLTNGRDLLVGYAGKNGQPYTSLGKIMGDEGLIPKDQVNFFTLRQWLYQHPSQAFALMERNPSYVFFRTLDTAAPVGAASAPLTPRISLAVDSRYIPYGLPLFLDSELPAMPQQQPVPLRRLMIAQDTGGAIRGPVRGDIFFGGGDEAEYYAGYMRGRGSYTLLVPREIAYQLK